MAIIVSKNGKNAKRVDQSSFGLEDTLQNFILNNPDSIPLYDIDEDIRLFIAAREFSTQSGPIDALGFDLSGNIYVIETKFYTNSDKRYIVAQALDYGASLWRHSTDFDEFIAQLNSHSEKQFGSTFTEKYAEFFGLEDPTENIQNIRNNLADGVIKFVVLMDKLHDTLKDLVIFVNQNSKFDLYAVELEYYKHAEFEIVIPKIFGAEVKKDVSSNRSRNQWKWHEVSRDDYWEETIKSVSDIRGLDIEWYKTLESHVLNLAKMIGASVQYGHVDSKTRNVSKLLLIDDAQKVSFSMDGDGWVAFYISRRIGKLAEINKQLLWKLIDLKMFRRDESYRDASQFAMRLDKYTKTDIEKLIKLYLEISKEVIK